MKRRLAKTILKGIERGKSYRPDVMASALATMSRYPADVERLSCQPHETRFWGATYTVKPVLVWKRFGDGAFWGTLSPINNRPNYYLVMGDSSWKHNDTLRNSLDEVFDQIEDEYGYYSFYCDECKSEYYEEENTCCSSDREWPALIDGGVSWCFPCFRNWHETRKMRQTNNGYRRKREARKAERDE